MKFRISVIIAAFVLSLSSQVFADNGKPCTIYASILRSSPPPGTPSFSGLYAISLDGKDIKFIGMKNAFSLDVYPEKNLYYAACGNGVFVSRDGGKSWRQTSGWTMTEVQYVSALKDNPAVVYAGTPYGLFKSEEYGENFRKLTDKFIECMMPDAADASAIFIGQEDGLYVSADAGKTFTKIEMNFNSQVNALAQDPGNPDRIYAGTEDKGIYISDDHGKTWNHAPAPADTVTVYGITVDPSNPDRVFAGTYNNGVMRSVDKGRTWQGCTKGLEGIPVFCIVTDPDMPDVVFAGTNIGGLMKSTDGGVTWQKFAFDTAQIWKIQIK